MSEQANESARIAAAEHCACDLDTACPVHPTEKTQVEQMARDLLRAKHGDNPAAPFPMVRDGCALALAEALHDLGWRRS